MTGMKGLSVDPSDFASSLDNSQNIVFLALLDFYVAYYHSDEFGSNHITFTATLDGKFRIPVLFLDTIRTPDCPRELR